MRSRAAAVDVLHASPMNAPCYRALQSTAWCRQVLCLCSWRRPCDPETVCQRRPQHCCTERYTEYKKIPTIKLQSPNSLECNAKESRHKDVK